MKIGLCSDSFLPIVDGVGRVVFQYATILSEMGHECYVITPINETGYRGSYNFDIVDYVSVPVPTAEQYRTGAVALDPHYAERVKNIDFDIIHAHSPALSGVEAIRLARKLKVPLVGTFHSKYRDDFMRYTHSDVLSNIGTKYVVGFFSHCDEVWTVSRNAAATLESYGYRGRARIMPNGCVPRLPNPENERLAREKYKLKGLPVLLYVGQIDRKKNIFRIVEAAKLLRTRGRDFKLVFAGQGADLDELADELKIAGLEQCSVLAGHIYDSELLDGLYMAASMFVFPSQYDTAGLVVGEAAMMGTPSLVVKGTAPAEFISDGVNGVVCEDSAGSLCDAMERMLYNAGEGELERMSELARTTIPKPWKELMQTVERAYLELIEEKNEGWVR